MFRYDDKTIKEIEHTADIGIEAIGDTLSALFANLAFGMLSLIVPNPVFKHTREKSLSLSAPSLNELIVIWLSEINYILQVEHFLSTGIEIELLSGASDKFNLTAVLSGCNSHPYEADFKTEIKAVTYHHLTCQQKNDHYVAQVIFDI